MSKSGRRKEFPGLSIIGERINPGFNSTRELFENEDIAGIQTLAADQVAKGAVALNINAGERALEEPAWMTRIIQAVQEAAPVPLSFDFPNVEVQRACLAVYDGDRAGGPPIINSISELRWDMLDLLEIRPCKMVLMASERSENGRREANHTAQEVHETAARMVRGILDGGYGLAPDDLIIDVSLGPVGADTEGLTRMAVDAITRIGQDPDLEGVHMSVGLSNISIMLPTRAIDGKPLKSRIESAFLTLTVPHGLDTIIGTPGRAYRMLPDDDIVLQGFREAMEVGGFESIMRIREIYSA